MTTYNENDHDRDTAGQFAKMSKSAPEIASFVAPEERQLSAAERDLAETERAIAFFAARKQEGVRALLVEEAVRAYPAATNISVLFDPEDGYGYVYEVLDEDGQALYSSERDDENYERETRAFQELTTNICGDLTDDGFGILHVPAISAKKNAEELRLEKVEFGSQSAEADRRYHQAAARSLANAISQKYPTAAKAVLIFAEPGQGNPDITYIVDTNDNALYDIDEDTDLENMVEFEAVLVDCQDGTAMEAHCMEPGPTGDASEYFNIKRWS